MLEFLPQTDYNSYFQYNTIIAHKFPKIYFEGFTPFVCACCKLFTCSWDCKRNIHIIFCFATWPR